MAINIISTEKFKANLEQWLFKNDQRAADYLFQNRTGIPNVFRSYPKKLYRGMSVGDDFIKKAYNGRYTFDQHTSWTKDIAVAQKFIDDPAYALGTTMSPAKHKIIISKVVPQRDVIIDIDGFVMFMGAKQLEMLGYDPTNINSALKEKEVLIGRGMTVTRSEYNIVT